MQKRRHVLDVQRPLAGGMARSVHPALRSLEVRAYVVPAPTDIAHLPPIIEVGGHPAAVHQRVDGTRAADYPAARPVNAAPVQSRIRQGLVLPIDRRIRKGSSVSDRGLDPKSSVAAAGFENQYPVASTGRQTVGEDAPRGAGADDYVVNIIHVRSLAFRSRRAMPFRDSPMSFFEDRLTCFGEISIRPWPSRNATETCMVRR